MSDFDVCVVGGGPSGVITAISIARAGYSCVILDKKPRHKIGDKNCGDALDSLHVDILTREMKISPPSLEKREARDILKTTTIAVKTLETKFSADTPGYLVDRLAYGQRLLTEAEEAGVEIIANSSVCELILESNQIVGVKYYDEKRIERQVLAKITVDASGYAAIIRKFVPDELKNAIEYSLPNDLTIVSYREIIKLNRKEDHNFREEIVLIYHENIRPPGYIWIFSEGEKKLNIGIAWVKSIDYPDGKSMKKLFHEYLDPYFDPKDYEVLTSGGGNIPMRPNYDSLVFNGALLVGDAAAMADPTTFEGHGPALESGRLAGKAIIKALKKKSFKVQDLWSYNKELMTYPGGMHAQSYLAAKMLDKLNTKGIHYLLSKKIITENELRTVFQDKETNLTLKYKIWKFLKAFPRWDLMLIVRKYVNLIEKAGDIYQDYPENPSDLNDWRDKRNSLLEVNF